jgi:hypothetical protein
MDMRTASFASLLLLSLFSIPACGGSVNSDSVGDATPDGGGDAPVDSPASDSPVDTPVDSHVVRIPKQHRAAATTCAPSPGGSSSVCSTGGGGPPGSCKSDSECTTGKNGHCAPAGGGIFMCACFYDTCANDSDCTTGGPCACAGTPHQSVSNGCAPAGNCKVDADCGPTGFCSPSGGSGCSDSISGYFCHVPSDECVDDDDCKSSTSGPAECRFDTTKKHWACAPLLACA